MLKLGWLKQTFTRRLRFFRTRRRNPFVWGGLRKTEPVSRIFGYDRGSQSIGRYYIDRFFAQYTTDITGYVLEIGDDTYTVRNGHDVIHSDVLHVRPGNPKATIVADLTCSDTLEGETYDCVVMPQTLPFIYDIHAALRHSFRLLKRDGVLLATLSGISQISRYDMERWGDYWRFTSASARSLFAEVFPAENLTIQAHGNVLSAIALLEGMASTELKKAELDYSDPDYEVIITVRAVKPREIS